MLFSWIKTDLKRKLKWAQHDCWVFTGHCSHFVSVKCEQWKMRCFCCPKREATPLDSLLILCKKSFFEKETESFSGVNNMKSIAPSHLIMWDYMDLSA